MQAMLKLIYPPACLSCGGDTAEHGRLCGPCRGEVPFITGLVCDKCGVPLPGDDPGTAILCDDCMALARPWDRGRAALLYKGRARKLVLAFKHGDRTDLARPMAGWLAQAARPVLGADMVVVPVPVHRLRLFRRRYNQAALLAGAVARLERLGFVPDALIRPVRTPALDGKSRQARFAAMAGAIAANPRASARICGREVLLVDDVMTSGATLAAAADALFVAGASRVCIAVLARVGWDA